MPSWAKAGVDNKVAKKGTRSLFLYGSKDTSKPWFWQDLKIELTGGKEYVVSCWMKSKNIIRRATLYLTAKDAKGKNLLHQRIAEVSKSADWKFFSRKITVPSGANFSTLRFAMSGKGKVWLDALSIKGDPGVECGKISYDKFYPLKKSDTPNWNKITESEKKLAYRVGHAEAVILDAEDSSDEKDLSFTFKAAYDDRFFYLRIAVTDDAIVTKTPYWEGDSIQVAIDPLNQKHESGTGKGYFAFGFIPANNKVKIQLDRSFNSADLTTADIKADLTKKTGGYIMDIRFPLDKLNLHLTPNSRFGLSIAVNDCDRKKRKWAQWGGGIVLRKRLSEFGTIGAVGNNGLFTALSRPKLIDHQAVFEVSTLNFNPTPRQETFKLAVGNSPVSTNKIILKEGKTTFMVPVPLSKLAPGINKAVLSCATMQDSIMFKKPVSQNEYAKQLAALTNRTSELRKLYQTGVNASLDMAAVKVSLTVAELFIPYIKSDIAVGKQENVISVEIKQLGEVLTNAIKSAKFILDNKAEYPLIPDIKVDRAELNGSNWYVNGREVFLFGFNQMDIDYLKYLPDLGCNMTDIHGGSARWGFKDGEKILNEGLFKRIIAQLNSAKKHRLKVAMGFGHRLPGWLVKKFPATVAVKGHFMNYDINNPVARSINLEYFEEIAKRTRNYPEIMSYDLWNEVGFKAVSKLGLQKFRENMHKKYRNITALNQSWKTSYSSFDQLTPEKTPDRSLAAYLDWCRWNNARVTGYIQELSRAVLRGNPKAQNCVKVCNDMTFEGSVGLDGRTRKVSRHDEGIDRQALADLLPLQGCDTRLTRFNPDERFSFAWLVPGMCYDLQLSMAPDKPIFEGEWHGLQTVYSTDVDAPAEFLDAALFYSYLRGVSANIMWWWSRRGLKTKGDWYYGSMLTLPRMLDAYGKNCIKAQRLAPVITAFKRNKPEVCIYYSETAAISHIKYIDALQKTYESLNWQGVRLGFVTTKMLSQTDCKLLIVPGAEYLPETEKNLLENKQNIYITSNTENWDMLFKKFGIERQNKCLVAGQKDSFPVEFRYTVTGKDTFFYLINLGKETVKVTISGKHDDLRFVDLLSGQNLTGTLTLPKYKLYILKKITK